MAIRTNIVSNAAVKKVQLETLKTIAESIACSFGPMGSNTLIVKDQMLTKYSKDGFTLLKEMKFLDVIAESVRSDMEDILRNIVLEFGDNSTSAAILAYLIFKGLNSSEAIKEEQPYKVIRNLKEVVNRINEKILANAKPCDPEVMYNIAYTSTNGNEQLAQVVKDIYTEYGNDVYVDVSTSNTEDFIVKKLDGLTLESGFMDTCMITNKSKATASVRNASIYYFEDPIDTPEMAAFFDTIIGRNIIEPINQHTAPTPTVIMCPMLSKDFSSTIKQLVEFMLASDPANRPPLLVITNIYDKTIAADITHLCGCPSIKKYIDPNNQAADIEKGLAPDLMTITQFCGYAELVESTVNTTKFVNPAKMYELDEESGEMKESAEFTALLDFLDAEIRRQEESGAKATSEVGLLTRRKHALKSNVIELLVGGISPAERDSAKELIEDAILNCRSAAKFGYGFGANYEGLAAALAVEEELSYNAGTNEYLYPYAGIILDAYKTITCMLYDTVYTHEESKQYLNESMLTAHEPLNLRTGKFDGKVLTSIKSDVAVLNALSRIISIMFTCNQALLMNPALNNYEE